MSAPASPRLTAERFALAAALRFPDLAEEASLAARDFVDDERLGAAWDGVARVAFRSEDGRLPIAHLSAESGVGVDVLAAATACQVFTHDQARHWWQRLRDLSTSGRLEHELVALARRTRQGDDRTGELLAELEQLRQRYSSQELEREVMDQAEVAATYVAERSAELRLGRRLGLVTGLETIDEWMGGLNSGELTTLAAAGGAGKSTFALDIARRAATAGTSVLIFSAEMTARQVGQREVHAELGRSIADRSVSAPDLQDALQRILEAKSGYAQRIRVDFRTRLTAPQVLATARRVQGQRGLGLLVFDHLGHWDCGRPRAQREERVSEAIQQAKDLAKLLDVPILVLTHFSRARREADWPTMELIRDSGKIDDVSDNIIALWRPSIDVSQLHLLKARQTGQAGRAMSLCFELRGQRFGEIEEVFRSSHVATPFRRESASRPSAPPSSRAPF